MRWVTLIAVVAVALMFFGGWLYFEDSGDKSEIILDKQEVKQDTQKALDTGKEVIKDAAEGLKQLGERVDDAVTDDKAAGEEEGVPVPDPTNSQPESDQEVGNRPSGPASE